MSVTSVMIHANNPSDTPATGEETSLGSRTYGVVDIGDDVTLFVPAGTAVAIAALLNTNKDQTDA